MIACNELDSGEVYAFADVNCNLVIKFADDDYRHFSNKADLEAMFDSVDVEDEDV